ncbi:hypothetical protein R3W88_010317 [Solanum pinnatisectum]|uniref:Dynein light chain n=1 Tax=Solanum pinnatisectum TaxID=50273 RepID=A0AAV9MDW5_9SOLN|nr:hypothetical protein R3W88_010317 [Solanum pinnatisectum]
MLEGKGVIEDTDMPVKMQIQGMRWASQALDVYDVLDYRSIAAHIKKEFDKKYGGGWQCVVGSNLDVSSLILKEHLSISPWRLLTSSSSKEPLLLNELLIVKTGLVITL